MGVHSQHMSCGGNMEQGNEDDGLKILRKNRSKARMKYDKAKAKLQTNIEQQLTKKIPEAIQELKTAWEKLEETQDEYVLELHEADKSDETDKINKEFSDLESDKEKLAEAGEEMAPKSFFKDEPDEQPQYVAHVAHGSKPNGSTVIENN